MKEDFCKIQRSSLWIEKIKILKMVEILWKML